MRDSLRENEGPASIMTTTTTGAAVQEGELVPDVLQYAEVGQRAVGDAANKCCHPLFFCMKHIPVKVETVSRNIISVQTSSDF